MAQKDKAKAYDKALEKARQLCAYPTTKPFISDLQDLFPELQESEDEMVRNEMISYFKQINYDNAHTWNGVNLNKFVDWLEKQGEQKPIISDDALREGIAHFGITQRQIDNWLKKYVDVEKQREQKPADKVEPKFHEGNWIVEDVDASTWLVTKVFTTEENVTAYNMINQKGRTFVIGSHNIDYRYHFWTIKDAKDGDVLCYKDEISVYKHIIKNCTKQETTFGGFVYHCCYDGKRFITDSLYSLTEQDKMDIHPATKEQRDLLFKKMREAGYEWDAEMKELKKIDNEEFYGEDYGIDSLYHAQRILEETLGEVAGYQSDDGILEHKCAISAVKQLAKQKSVEWSEEDEEIHRKCICAMRASACGFPEEEKFVEQVDNWLKSLKYRIQPKQEWSEEDENRFTNLISVVKCSKENDATKEGFIKFINKLKSLKDKVGNFNYGYKVEFSAAKYKQWKPSNEQMATFWDAICTLNHDGYKWINGMKSLYQDLKKLTEK